MKGVWLKLSCDGTFDQYFVYISREYPLSTLVGKWLWNVSRTDSS